MPLVSSNEFPASLSQRSCPLTFLTLPREIRNIVYDFCDFFGTNEVYCSYAYPLGLVVPKIFYVCRQTYEEVQPRYYGSKWFILDMTPRDFIDQIGVSNAKAIRKLSVRWTMYKPDLKTTFDTFEELGLLAEERIHGISVLAIHLMHPWTFPESLRTQDFESASSLMHDISKNPQYIELYGKKIFGAYRCRGWKVVQTDGRYYRSKALVLMIGHTSFDDDDRVSLK